MADGRSTLPPADPQSVARDWITIWQSELTALAADREYQEAWIRLVGLWAAAAAATRLLPGPASDQPAAAHEAGPAGPAAPPRATPPVAAPDARDATLQRLADRVAELERRLAGLDQPDGGAGA